MHAGGEEGVGRVLRTAAPVKTLLSTTARRGIRAGIIAVLGSANVALFLARQALPQVKAFFSR